MTASPSFLFAGGGSGGHLFPGIAVASELVRRDPSCRIAFAGSNRGIEQTVLKDTDWLHIRFPMDPVATAARHPFQYTHRLAASVHQAVRLIEELKPQAVIGLGGYASVPVGIAARYRRVPLVLLEQNVVPGRATSWLSRIADRVCVSFPESIKRLPQSANAVVTGNPLRRVTRQRDARTLRPPRLLILGGSQGSLGLNRMVVEAVTKLECQLVGWNVIHQTGKRDLQAVRTAYERTSLDVQVEAFLTNMPDVYAGATLAISRAGATTLAELACIGCPVILIPYPGAIRDHQTRNAEHYVSIGGALLVSESSARSNELTSILSDLLRDPARLASMSLAIRRAAVLDAAERVADLLLPQAASRRAA